jgi:hypothetical protein
MAKLKLTDTWKPYRRHCQLYVVKGSRFGLMMSERGKRPHKKPKSQYAIKCMYPGFPLLADQRIFSLLCLWWARGWGYHYDPYPPEPVPINKAAWNAFAAAIDYYITPTQTTKLTGFRAYIAWNQTALSAQFLRIQTTTKWTTGYPFVQWPEPPASYAPILTQAVTMEIGPWYNWLTYTPDPQPPDVHRLALLYTSGAAQSGKIETKGPLTYSYTDEHWQGDPLPEHYYDIGRHFSNWHCHGPGYVSGGLQIVDQATGSPAPIVRADPIYIP